MAMHQGRQSPSQSRLPRLSSAAKAARALCVFKQKQSFPKKSLSKYGRRVTAERTL